MLSGVRVIDVTDERGHLAGKILGDLGADVIKVEPPGGDPLRMRGPFVGGEIHPEAGIPWLAMNTSKRGIVLDLHATDDQLRFLELVAASDVVLESFHPGKGLDSWELGTARLAAARPGIIHCAVTPFGSTGPRSEWLASDHTCVAAGGNAALTGDPDRAPLASTAPTAYLHAAAEAAIGILFALRRRHLRDPDAGTFVDVSIQETQLATLITAPGQYALSGKLRQRAGARIGRTREIWRTADGWISFGLRGGPARAAGLAAIVALMGEHGAAPEWLASYDWKRFDANRADPEELARLDAAFAGFFASQSSAALYAQAVARRLMLAPCQDASAALADPQLRARDFFVPVSTGPFGRGRVELPGGFARTVDDAIGVRCRAPGIGEHESSVWADVRASFSGLHPRVGEASSPRACGAVPDSDSDDAADSGPIFAGLRFLELGAGAAGPAAAKYFVEHGATVIRVESALRPDFIRLLHVSGGAPSVEELDRSPMFALLNAGKKSVALNLAKPRARELLGALVRWADVLTENFTPGVLAKWGYGDETLAALNPRLVRVSSSLFGQTGPHRDYPGFGGQGAALAGFNHLTGWPDREPIGPYATITDSLAPRFIAAAIAAALLEREKTGRGRALDVSQVEAGVYALSAAVAQASATGSSPVRLGNRSLDTAPHGVFPCLGNDRWLALAVRDDHQWEVLARELHADSIEPDPSWLDASVRLANPDAVERAITLWTQPRRAEQLAERLQRLGIEAHVVQTCADLMTDPQLAHREHFQKLAHPALGTVAVERAGFRISGARNGFASAGPLLGEHTAQVLRDIVGLDDDQIAALAREQVTA